MPDPFGSTAPAMAAPQQKGGKDTRGRTIAGIAMQMLSIALPLLNQSTGPDKPPSEDAVAVSDAYNRLIKHFSKPPADMAMSELKFMQSQLAPMPRPSAMDQGPQIKSSLEGMGVQPGAQQPSPAMAG